MKSIKQLNNVWVDRKGCEGAEEGHYNYLSKTLPAQTVMFLLLIWQDHKLLLLTALSEEVLVSKETRQLYYGRKHRFAVMLLLSAQQHCHLCTHGTLVWEPKGNLSAAYVLKLKTAMLKALLIRCFPKEYSDPYLPEQVITLSPCTWRCMWLSIHLKERRVNALFPTSGWSLCPLDCKMQRSPSGFKKNND